MENQKTNELFWDYKLGMVKDPKYPCYKGSGLCKIRTLPDSQFECSTESAYCYFRLLEKDIKIVVTGTTPVLSTTEQRKTP